MKDEILIEKKDGEMDDYDRPIYIVTSVHKEAINNMVRNQTIDDVDLESLKQLGFAVAYNKLDKHGNKRYIKHNTRTFEQKMKRKKDIRSFKQDPRDEIPF
jgi:translation initiation factor IF-2